MTTETNAADHEALGSWTWLRSDVPVVATCRSGWWHVYRQETDAERAAHIGSALPGATLIDGVRVEASIAIVMVGASLEGPRNDEILVYGQLVCTLDARSDITGVFFMSGSDRITVPTGDAALTKATLTTADYQVLFGAR